MRCTFKEGTYPPYRKSRSVGHFQKNNEVFSSWITEHLESVLSLVLPPHLLYLLWCINFYTLNICVSFFLLHRKVLSSMSYNSLGWKGLVSTPTTTGRDTFYSTTFYYSTQRLHSLNLTRAGRLWWWFLTFKGDLKGWLNEPVMATRDVSLLKLAEGIITCCLAADHSCRAPTGLAREITQIHGQLPIR